MILIILERNRHDQPHLYFCILVFERHRPDDGRNAEGVQQRLHVLKEQNYADEKI